MVDVTKLKAFEARLDVDVSGAPVAKEGVQNKYSKFFGIPQK